MQIVQIVAQCLGFKVTGLSADARGSFKSHLTRKLNHILSPTTSKNHVSDTLCVLKVLLLLIFQRPSWSMGVSACTSRAGDSKFDTRPGQVLVCFGSGCMFHAPHTWEKL